MFKWNPAILGSTMAFKVFDKLDNNRSIDKMITNACYASPSSAFLNDIPVKLYFKGLYLHINILVFLFIRLECIGRRPEKGRKIVLCENIESWHQNLHSKCSK